MTLVDLSNPGRSLTRDPANTVTVVLPAYREEANIESTAEDFLSTLETGGYDHWLVIVNDGSPDATGAIADRLEHSYPGRVRAVHHSANQGYGAAVRTGIRTALDETDSAKIFLTDSDGQFKAEELIGFLQVAQSERADVVIGYRPDRADSFMRKLNGLFWTLASRLLLRTGSRDVDCAYKLVDRRVLADVNLLGEAATISPELLAKIRAKGARVIERPVRHYPRVYGEQTGAKLTVILRSLLGLARLHLELLRTEGHGRIAKWFLHRGDAVLTVVTSAAVALSLGSYVYFAVHSQVLAYPDAVSHLLIARRVVASSTPGLAQLGGVWLPLPHLLSAPLVLIGSFYSSGFAGSAISMLAYIVTVRYLYLIGSGATGNKVAGVVAAGVFAINPNVLYMQSTPMTETLLLACVAGATFYLMRWCQTGSHRYLAGTSVATLLATATRYEGWVLFVAVSLVVTYVSLRRWRSYKRFEASLILFAGPAAAGIVGWVLWNAVIFHNALYFQDGTFAKPSLWVSSGDKAIGHLSISLRTYWIALTDNFGFVALGLAAAGLAYFLYRTRLRPETVAPLVSLAFLPFFVLALYSGQRPLHVPQISGNLYNVRFGLVMALAIAIFTSFLVVPISHLAGTGRHIQRLHAARIRQVAYACLCAAIAVPVLMLGSISTLKEADVFRASSIERNNATAAAWLTAHYDHGRVLMESFGNETVTFESHILSNDIIYEGSYQLWEPALANPAGHHIQWIYMRRTPGNRDDVWRRLHSSHQLRSYRLVYQDRDRLVYRYAGTGPANGSSPGLIASPRTFKAASHHQPQALENSALQVAVASTESRAPTTALGHNGSSS